MSPNFTQRAHPPSFQSGCGRRQHCKTERTWCWSCRSATLWRAHSALPLARCSWRLQWVVWTCWHSERRTPTLCSCGRLVPLCGRKRSTRTSDSCCNPVSPLQRQGERAVAAVYGEETALLLQNRTTSWQSSTSVSWKNCRMRTSSRWRWGGLETPTTGSRWASLPRRAFCEV